MGPFQCTISPFVDKTHRMHIQLIGSCNGLICLLCTKNGHLCIWNPSTREYKNIEIFSSSTSVRYGFGYDANIDDYKLVRIAKKSGCTEVDVYALRSDSWKRVQSINAPMFRLGRNYPGLLVHGALHWLSITTSQGISTAVIVSFDISNETLIDVPYPKGALEGDQEDYKNLGVLGDCLCLVVDYHGRTDVWVMQDYGAQESWTKVDCKVIKNKLTCYGPWGFILTDEKYGSARIIHMHNGNRAMYLESLVSLNSGTFADKGT